MKKKTTTQSDQCQTFIDAAYALGCDESEEHFDADLKKVAARKPPDDSPAPKPERKSKPAK